MYYSIEKKLVRVEGYGKISQPFVAVMTVNEFEKGDFPPGFELSQMSRYPKPHFCKAEVHEDLLSGTLSIPDKKSLGKTINTIYIDKIGSSFIKPTELNALLKIV